MATYKVISINMNLILGNAIAKLIKINNENNIRER